jgi:hypothetical protein
MDFDAEAAVRDLVRNQMASFRTANVLCPHTTDHTTDTFNVHPDSETPARLSAQPVKKSTPEGPNVTTAGLTGATSTGRHAWSPPGPGTLDILEQARQAARAAFDGRSFRTHSAMSTVKTPLSPAPMPPSLSPIRALSPMRPSSPLHLVTPSRPSSPIHPTRPSPARLTSSYAVGTNDHHVEAANARHSMVEDAVLAQHDATVAAAVAVAVSEERQYLMREADHKLAAAQAEMSEAIQIARGQAVEQNSAAISQLKAEHRGQLANTESDAAAALIAARAEAAAELALAVRAACEETATQGSAAANRQLEELATQHAEELQRLRTAASSELVTSRKASAIELARAVNAAQQQAASHATATARTELETVRSQHSEALCTARAEHEAVLAEARRSTESALTTSRTQAATELSEARRSAASELQRAVGVACAETARQCDAKTTAEIADLCRRHEVRSKRAVLCCAVLCCAMLPPPYIQIAILSQWYVLG